MARKILNNVKEHNLHFYFKRITFRTLAPFLSRRRATSSSVRTRTVETMVSEGRPGNGKYADVRHSVSVESVGMPANRFPCNQLTRLATTMARPSDPQRSQTRCNPTRRYYIQLSATATFNYVNDFALWPETVLMNRNNYY